MSLINKLLTDLDARHVPPAQRGGRVLDGLQPVRESGHRRIRIPVNSLIVVLFLVLSVTATYALISANNKRALAEIAARWPARIITHPLPAPGVTAGKSAVVIGSTADRAEPPAATAAPGHSGLKLDLSLPVRPATLPPAKTGLGALPADSFARIESVELRELGTDVALNLVLDRPALFVSNRLSNPDRLVVEFSDAVFTGVIPAMRNVRGIENVRVQSTAKGGVRLVLDLSAAMDIRNSEQTVADGKQSLSFLLVPKASAEQPASTAEAVITEVPQVSNYGDMQITARQAAVADTPREMYLQAVKNFRQGNAAMARQLLLDLLAAYPRDIDARTLLAAKLVDAGNRSEAARVLRQGLAVLPHVAAWANLLARILVDRNEIMAAIEVLERAAPDVAAGAEYHAFLAALYQRADRHRDAAESYRRILQQRPGNGVWWMGLAISLERTGRPDDALYAYRQALQTGAMKPELLRFVQRQISRLNLRLRS